MSRPFRVNDTLFEGLVWSPTILVVGVTYPGPSSFLIPAICHSHVMASLPGYLVDAAGTVVVPAVGRDVVSMRRLAALRSAGGRTLRAALAVCDGYGNILIDPFNGCGVGYARVYVSRLVSATRADGMRRS